mmetsp:Transcript_86744/g.265500  ORF Transcript_86744/g.265500 Transcript_86744/m.265500 type:complete len:342 (-) Transcript_86744:161-1186(-)
MRMWACESASSTLRGSNRQDCRRLSRGRLLTPSAWAPYNEGLTTPRGHRATGPWEEGSWGQPQARASQPGEEREHGSRLREGRLGRHVVQIEGNAHRQGVLCVGERVRRKQRRRGVRRGAQPKPGQTCVRVSRWQRAHHPRERPSPCWLRERVAVRAGVNLGEATNETDWCFQRLQLPLRIKRSGHMVAIKHNPYGVTGDVGPRPTERGGQPRLASPALLPCRGRAEDAAHDPSGRLLGSPDGFLALATPESEHGAPEGDQLDDWLRAIEGRQVPRNRHDQFADGVRVGGQESDEASAAMHKAHACRADVGGHMPEELAYLWRFHGAPERSGRRRLQAWQP